MIRKILLIRHSKPDFPGGVHICLGRHTDAGICAGGAERARTLGMYLKNEISEAGRIFTSPLRRARETAAILSGGLVPVEIEDGLTEMDMGEWDGLDFGTIRENYKELYEQRAFDLSLPPPGGETFPDASRRMRETLTALAKTTPEDTLVVVSHSGAIRALLCDLLNIPYRENRSIPQEYTALNTILYDEERESLNVLKN